MSDIRKLIEAVEGGEWWGDLPRPAELHTDLCWKAFSGSLDAAKALHEALLPGWKKNLTFTEFADGSGAVTMFGPLADDAGKWDFAPKYEARCNNPARAWLLAILRAVEARQ